MQRHLINGEAMPSLCDDAHAKLLAHKWPGNVRELDNVVQRALILRTGNEITAENLCFENEEVSASPAPTYEKPTIENYVPAESNANGSGSLSSDLKSVEDKMILDALQSGNGSRKIAAEILGISPRTLRYKIARLREAGISIPR